MNDNPCIMYLFRHGATASNVARPPRLQGRGINLGLSPAGQTQAAQAAELLARLPLRAVYASPLVRSRETAAAIARPHGLPVGERPDLTEADVGRWEGQSWETIARDDAQAYAAFQADCGTHGYAGGENLQQVQSRVVPCLAQLAGQHAGQHIAVVGHNVVNRAFLAHVLMLPLAFARTLVQDNGGVNLLHWQSGAARLITMNAVFHLRASEPSG